jgi:hypothetical protein
MMKKEKFTNKIIQKFGIPIVFATALYWIHSQNCITPGTNPLLAIFTIFGGAGILVTLLRGFNIGKESMAFTMLTNGMLLIPVYFVFSMVNQTPIFDYGSQEIIIASLIIVAGASIKAYMEIKK